MREVPGGLFSSWLVHDVRAGDEIEVGAPTGSFTPDLATAAHHVLIAAANVGGDDFENHAVLALAVSKSKFRIIQRLDRDFARPHVCYASIGRHLGTFTSK